jgi:hypothetical protein
MMLEGAMRDQGFRWRFRGTRLSAWLPAPQKLAGALRLDHLARQHPDELGRWLEQWHTPEDSGPVAAQAFEVVEKHETR